MLKNRSRQFISDCFHFGRSKTKNSIVDLFVAEREVKNVRAVMLILEKKGRDDWRYAFKSRESQRAGTEGEKENNKSGE